MKTLHAEITHAVSPLIFNIIAVHAVAEQDLDDAEITLRDRLNPETFWVYRGGSHIAIHRKLGEKILERIALVADKPITPRGPATPLRRSVTNSID